MKRSPVRPWVLVFAAFVAVVAIGGLWLRHRVRASLPALDGSISVPGLSAKVEVLRDAHGVPHIRAQSIADALFAQGYVTAQDRLWQMDLSRRKAEGELSEIFGGRTLRMDVESRTWGLRGLAERSLAGISPEQHRLLEAYVRGVNAFIETHRDRLPWEFAFLGYQPRPWREVDSVGVALNLGTSLSNTWGTDLIRERIRAKLGKDLAADVFPDHSALDMPVADTSSFRGKKAAPATSERAQGNIPPKLSSLASPVDALFADQAELPSMAAVGSNNWAINGSHTQGGKPLLANDPHIDHSAPSVWYMVHLKAPGLNVSGVSLPGLPFVVIGHNQHIAWGMTNTAPDVQDLYIETFDPHHPAKYLHNGQWVDAEVRDETIKIRGQRDYHLTVEVTRHGPIISREGGRQLALQWTLLMPGGVGLPFMGLDEAGNWQQFTAALRELKVAMQNVAYADDQGNIGVYSAGMVPIRKHGDGSVPVPGSTDDYDWTGFIPFEDLPHAFNPPDGIIATANGRIVPDDYPYFITARWEAPFRTARINQLLRAGSGFTVADMLRIQADILSLEDLWLAKELLAAGGKQPPSSAGARYALDVIKGWDGEARADSSATLILKATRGALRNRILQPKLGDDVRVYRWAMSTVFLQNVLDQNLTRWLPPGDADFNVTLMKSLEEAVNEIPSMVHSQNHSDWKWGDTIPLTFHHPLGGLPLLGRWLDVGPFPQAGTGTTVKQTTPNLGPSMRMVVDFSDLDKSVQNITLGESGEVSSPYYKDQLAAWFEGRSFPMLFSDAAVDQGAVHKLELEPGR